MSYVEGDPYWITARREDGCGTCGAWIAAGDRVWCWPKGKKTECAPCGADAERRFLAETADEVWQ